MKCPVCQNDQNSQSLLQFQPRNSSISGNNEISFSLSLCDTCQHFYNSDFQVEKIDYSSVEFETFYTHPDFSDAMRSSIDIIRRFVDVKHPHFFDFGCGDGAFLKMVRRHCEADGLPIEISGYEVGKFSKIEHFITGSLSEFREALTSAENPVLVARHVLEHLSSFDDFESLIQVSDGLVYIEVPNGAQAIFQGRYEDLVYEHVSYFSYNSLLALIDRLKLIPLASVNGLYGENIGLICTSGRSYNGMLISNIRKSFFDQREKYQSLAQVLNNERVAFWGVGGRCRTILNNISSVSNTPICCKLFDSDVDKAGSKIEGYENETRFPTSDLLKSIETVVIGSRVAKNSIVSELKALDYDGTTILWDER